MNKLRKIFILIQAISRLSPVMALFMARRVARNKLAVKFPRWYQQRLAKIEAGLPLMSPTSEISPALQEVGDFYSAEYGDQIDSATNGKITLHGRTVDFDGPEAVNWKHKVPEEGDHQMWPVKLGHMGFFCPMLIHGGIEHQQAVAEMIKSFRATTTVSDRGAFNTYWFPYGVSHRVLSLTAGYLIARSQGTLPDGVEETILDFLRENVAFILDNVEYELCNNHVERNLAALCLYFTHVDTPPDWVKAKLARDIQHLANKTILTDGSQIERSPMYQGLSIVSQAVWTETPFLPDTLRASLTEKLDLARKAFAILCHPDGKVALFNDCWHHEVPVWNGSPAPDGVSLLHDAGYGRLSQGDDVCLLDAGALGPKWNPGHGHADFLSVEVTLAGQRLIVDPGTSRYNTGKERARERSAAAHNGPVWQGYEPVSFLGCFKIGRMAEADLIDADDLPELTIAGRFKDGPGTVTRAIRHYPDLGFLIADHWNRAEPTGAIHWLIPTQWAAKQREMSISLSHEQSGAEATFDILKAQVSPVICSSDHAHHYGKCEPAHEIQITPERKNATQSALLWVGRQAAPENALTDGDQLIELLDELSKN